MGLLAVPSLSSGQSPVGGLNLGGVVGSLLGSGSATGPLPGGLTLSPGATVGTYQPPLNDKGNPHGEGTVATATLGANALTLPGTAPAPVPGNAELVVGRSLGEYQTATKQLHGHITILSLFGSEIFGVDSTPGHTNTGPISATTKLCADSAGTICLNVLAATSATTNTSSINHFQAAGIGIPGLTADTAYSDGNITVDPVAGCQTTSGDARATNVKLGTLTAAALTGSQSGSTSCNDPTKNVAPSSLSAVVTLLGTPTNVPLLNSTGCSDGGPPTTAFGTGQSGTPNTDTGIPLLLPIVCNADDTNPAAAGVNAGAPNGPQQDTIPYTVREALTAFALQLTPTTSVAKITAAASQASSAPPPCPVAPATIPPGCPTTTTGTTAATTATTATTTGATTATTTGATTATTSPGTTGTGGPGGGNNSTGTTSTSTGVPGAQNNTTGNAGTTTGVTTSAAKLPFTGLNVLWLLLGGVTMLLAGTTLRRLGSRRHRPE